MSGDSSTEPPIRSEIFSLTRFVEHGRSLGLTHLEIDTGASFFKRAPVFFPRLESNMYALRAANKAISLHSDAGFDLSPAGDWLVDNFHLIDAQLKEIHIGLPRRYYESLPVLRAAPLAGLPRIYGVAWAFVAHTDSAFDEQKLISYLTAYQESCPLSLAELWALPTTLRVVLIENLRRLADRIVSVEAQNADQTDDSWSVRNAIISLRAIDEANWQEIVGQSSALMRQMLSSDVFAAEQKRTQDASLYAIERLAKDTGRDAHTIADALLTLMQTPIAGSSKAPAYWLSGRGRPVLWGKMEPTRTDVDWQYRAKQCLERIRLPIYGLVSILAATGLAAYVLSHDSVFVSQTLGLAKVLVVLLVLLPISEAVLAVMNRLISESVRPQYLPRFAFEGGIPASHRAIVVIPAMLPSEAAIHALAHRLHLHYLANPEAQAQFALLTDWQDAATEQTGTDAALLDCAKVTIAALNERYPSPMPWRRFILLHRDRTYSQSEQCWMGWERKRGKLQVLLSALARRLEGQHAPFCDLGELSHLAGNVSYVLTLDSDTQLPPGRLRELVGVAAHPLNTPQLDVSGRSIVSGYGIFQPRIVTPLPTQTEDTYFHWLFAGQCGMDTYSSTTSEVYQDLFAEGTFTGKGLLHVQAMNAVLSGLQSLPVASVLSHDLLEGALARCATVTDITLIEDAPSHPDVAASRIHRWTRGDWQLLPFLYQSICKSGGRKLSTLNHWKLFDNLRRSLVPMASLVLLLLAMFGYLISLQLAVTLVVAAYLAGPLLGVLAALIPSRRDVAIGYFFREGFIDLWRVLVGGLWHFALLPQHAFQSIDAITRTLYRLAISRRHLLQWTTAEAAQTSASPYFLVIARQHWQVTCAVLTLFFLGNINPFLGLIWLGTPLWIYTGSLPRRKIKGANLHGQERAYLLTVARETWTLFERTVVASERHLPPDNLQTSPYELIAHRTSPTNIGLYLLSACCAKAFGWIETTQLLDRLEATHATLSVMQRYKGHFLNWYDTQTGEPLLPMYVSTVDSGNLSGSLLAVSACCLELAKEMPASTQLTPLERERLLVMATSFERLAWAPDYAFLYHLKRDLFHIGFRIAEQQLDASFYDLLASESRLTSLLAIAKGDVPSKHWAALGRPFYVHGLAVGLRSWSGSMFEYLMPSLLLDEPQYSALHEASHMAVHEQISYASRLGVPWGMSESAYAQSDDTLAYQYGPQGVPRLALRRTPEGECVVAPYATALAAQLSPHLAIANFKRLASLSARTAYGFMEALDFTAARQISGAHDERVQTYMAHHQGMTIVALTNVLLQGAPRRWGMANAHIQAVSSLLQERLPREISARYAPSVLSEPHHLHNRSRTTFQEIVPSTAAPGLTQVLSNGRYSVVLRPSGAGYSRLGVLNISRWRDDALREACGSFIYLRRQTKTGDALVSLTQSAVPQKEVHYCCTFHADRVCFDATWSDLRTRVTVWVSPEDDIEFRQVEFFNLTRAPMDLTLYSAFDACLSPARADEAHPAFANLFVRAKYLAQRQAVALTRMPRLEGEAELHAVHFLIQEEERTVLTEAIRVQFDRARWQGRNHAPAQPLADFDDDAPSTGLDPVCAMSIPLRLEGASRTVLTLATAASHDAQEITRLMDKYQLHSAVQHASLMSTTLAGVRLRAQKMNAETLNAIQTMTTALILSLARAHDVANSLVALDKRLLWRLGISGDQPLIVISAQTMQGLGLVRSMMQALRWWCWCGVACDVVVLNAEPATYLMPLQHELQALRERHRRDCLPTELGASQPLASLYLLREDSLTHEEHQTLFGLARLHFMADGRSLVRHVQNWQEGHVQAYASCTYKPAQALVGRMADATAAVAQSGYAFQGDFEGNDFLFKIQATCRPAKPWINVLANPSFGAQISESGGGYSWAINSRLNQLTAWSNDPVMDTPSEWFLLQDQHSDELWSLTPLDPSDASLYQVTHGQGYSRFEHTRDGLQVTATWCVDAHSAVKQVHVAIQNLGKHPRKLRLVGIAEWQLGANRADRMLLHTAKVGGLPCLLATQRDHSAGFGGGTAFFALIAKLAVAAHLKDAGDWTCDRRECFDAMGRLAIPNTFSQQVGSGLDPCAALSARFEVPAGTAQQWTFLLGYAADQSQAQALAREAAAAIAAPVDLRLTAVQNYWNQLLGAVSVKTPDPLFDVMVNRWLIYQTVSCRLWARAGFYQAGGAIGFRDQLQDAMALSWIAPQMLQGQILLAASRQFEAGDVQHWWHEPTGAGIRTYSSDDLLWLPYAAWHYVQTTGQAGLFDQTVSFIEGASIPEGQSDIYDTPHAITNQATIYEHCARAIDRSLEVGMHGLPLMLGGDWNDGMNHVGSAGNGRGESVWLGWFLCRLTADFIPLAEARGELARAERWRGANAGWRKALSSNAWDGEWFKRGFFGSDQEGDQAIGSHINVECKIDSIAQSWSVLSGAASLAQQQQAMASVQTHLVDERLGLIKLLTPPFANSQPSPGYIQSYPLGVRENGGQYSHGAIWALMAQAQLAQSNDQRDLAYRYFTYLSPAHRAAHPVQGAVYGLEPYAVAGDICSEPPYAGRGGWSWYTGASAWLQRAAIESIFGLEQRGDKLRFKPCLPSHWLQAEITLKRDDRTMRFVLIRMDEQKASAFDAQILRPLEWLNWTNLPLSSKFVIPI
jgi:cyclic beta-1,2-glucan synthetase